MNFDELQKQWDSQSSKEVKIDPNLELNREANTIIDRVRKTLRNECYFQIFGLLCLYVIPFLFDANTPIIWWSLLCVSFTFLVPFIYIFKFYKRSYKLEYNSLKNINWFYYNYKASVDIYSVYSYIIFILALMTAGIAYTQHENSLQFESKFFFFLYIILTIFFYMLICVLLLKWWITTYYKKHLIELKNILNQLEE